MTAPPETTNNGTRTTTVEAHPRLLREGEVSPFKILIAILLRENYTHVEVKSHKAPDRMALGGFFYKLISTEDMSYKDLRSQIRNPLNCVPTEIMLSFFRITENLDDENPCFLYELVHSIIDLIDSTQVILLKKRIMKNSPIGKYLRLVLLSIRKMSYPQVFHVYKQVCLHIKRDIDPAASNLQKPGSASVSRSFSRLYLQQHPPLHRGHPKPGLEAFGKMVQNRLAVGKSGLDMAIYNQFSIERRIQRNMCPPGMIQLYKEDAAAKRLKGQAKLTENVKLLRRNWDPLSLSSLPAPPPSSTDTTPTGIFSTPYIKKENLAYTEIPASKRFMAARGRRGSPRSPRKRTDSTPSSSPRSRLSRDQKSGFSLYYESEDGYFISEDEDDMSQNQSQGIGRRTRSQSQAARNSSGSADSSPRPSSATESPEQHEQQSRKGPLTPSQRNKFDPCDNVLPASSRWNSIKWNSRKLIEKTVKTLSNEMHRTGMRRYTPRDVSSFIESVRHNPSCQIILPQMSFLEYMNCLQIKDVTRCSEALRTSFDLRIKPNTSELTKGTPYAPYNFAVFNFIMGYKKDAMAFLEEAFQAGHSAYDGTCLDHCHNLWSSIRNKPYLDVIYAPTAIKEVDKNKAYLHSLNVISKSFDLHSHGQGPTDIFHGLWDSSTDYEFEAVESLVLQSVANFFTIFGWHKLVELPCFILLKSSDWTHWPSQNFCAALCSYAQSALVGGQVEKANSLIQYGRKLFRLEASLTGQMFGKQEAVFYALKAYLGNHPIQDSVLATLAAYDKTESYYWSAYNQMIRNDWEGAGKMLAQLWVSIPSKSCENNDLRLRALLLQAELNCLYGNPSGGLTYLFQALDLAELISAEFYITACHISIASIQCYIGLPSTAGRTLNQNIRTALRSSCPYLQAKMLATNTKIFLQLEEYQEPNPNAVQVEDDLEKLYHLFRDEEHDSMSTPVEDNDEPMPLFSKSEAFATETVQTLIQPLSKAEEIYKKWNNNYRLKEVLYVKYLLFKYVGQHREAGKVLKEMEALVSFCTWKPDTCIL